MAFENFPYTDYHALNLDWLLKKVRQHDTDITKIREEISAANLPQIVKDKLLEMVDDGTLAEIIETTVFQDLNDRVADLESKPVVEWYDSMEDLESSTAPVGATVVCNGENYIIRAENNGYGIETVNGWATPLHITDHLIYGEMDYVEYPMADYTGQTVKYNLQGGCYNETLNVYAFTVVQDNNASPLLITMRPNGTLVNSVPIDTGHSSGICWIPEKNYYAITTHAAGTGNIHCVNSNGVTVEVHETQSNGWPGSLAYDNISHLIWCMSTTYQEGGSYQPLLYAVDLNFNRVVTHKLSSKEYNTMIPNSAAYTAIQSSTCYRHNFIVASSVFFDDGFQTNAFRLTQINTETGKVETYYNGLFPKKVGGTEAECIINHNGELKVCGYYNPTTDSSTLCWREVSLIGQGSWR